MFKTVSFIIKISFFCILSTFHAFATSLPLIQEENFHQSELMAQSNIQCPCGTKQISIPLLKWTKDNQYLAATIECINNTGNTLNRYILIWSADTVATLTQTKAQSTEPMQFYQIQCDNDPITAIDWVHDNTGNCYFLAAGTQLGYIYIIKIKEDESKNHANSLEITPPATVSGSISSLIWSHNGKYLWVGTSQTYGLNVGSVQMFEFNKMQNTFNRRFIAATNQSEISVSPSGTSIIVATNNGFVHFLNHSEAQGPQLSLIFKPQRQCQTRLNIVKWHPCGEMFFVAQVSTQTPNIVNLKIFNNFGEILLEQNLSAYEEILNLSAEWLSYKIMLITQNKTSNAHQNASNVCVFDIEQSKIIQHHKLPGINATCATIQQLPDFSKFLTVGSENGFIYYFKLCV